MLNKLAQRLNYCNILVGHFIAENIAVQLKLKETVIHYINLFSPNSMIGLLQCETPCNSIFAVTQ